MKRSRGLSQANLVSVVTLDFFPLSICLRRRSCSRGLRRLWLRRTPSPHGLPLRTTSPPRQRRRRLRAFRCQGGPQGVVQSSFRRHRRQLSHESGTAQQQSNSIRLVGRGSPRDGLFASFGAGAEFRPSLPAKSAQRFLRWRGGWQCAVANHEGRGCVEATTVSTRVSSSVDEGKPIRAKIRG